MSTVDSHLHVNFNGFAPRDLVRYLDRERIDCCWLLTWEEVNPGPWDYHHLSIEDVWDMYVEHPDRIIPFYAPDPHRTDAAKALGKWQTNGVRGCGELKATLQWGSPEVQSLLDVAGRHRMPVVFHMEDSETRSIAYSDSAFDRLLHAGLHTRRKRYRIPQAVLQLLVTKYAPLRDRQASYHFPGYMLDMATLEASLRTHPQVSFVAHGPLFWRHMSPDTDSSNAMYPRGPVFTQGLIWRLLREYPNLYADTSARSGFTALNRDPDNARRFLSEFHDKILYGTDNMAAGQRQFIDSLRLPPETYRKITGTNAMRLIKP